MLFRLDSASLPVMNVHFIANAVGIVRNGINFDAFIDEMFDMTAQLRRGNVEFLFLFHAGDPRKHLINKVCDAVLYLISNLPFGGVFILEGTVVMLSQTAILLRGTAPTASV